MSLHYAFPYFTMVVLWQMHNSLGGPQSVRTERITEKELDSILKSHSESTWSFKLHMSISSLRWILKSDLNCFPYKFNKLTSWNPLIISHNCIFYVIYGNLLKTNSEFILPLIISDAHFHLNGYVNETVVCGPQKIWKWHKNVFCIHCQVTVLCGISANWIIRPCFFEDDNRNAATLNVERYQEIIENFLRPAVEERNL